MNLLSTLLGLAGFGKAPAPTEVVGAIAGNKITFGGLRKATSSLGSFIGDFEAAIAAKNYVSAVELTIEEALEIAADVGVPYAGLAEKVIPLLFFAASHPADTNSPAMQRAAGPENVSLS
jgi:hypothetical protein